MAVGKEHRGIRVPRSGTT